MALALVLFEDRLLDGRHLIVAEALAGALALLLLDLGEHPGGLFATHHGDARVGPHPEEARVVGAAAHAVVAGTEAAADEHGELRHLGAGHRGDQLGAVLGDATGLVFLPDHETGDVLQEQQRDAALAGQLDEVRAFLRRLGEEDAVVGEDGDRVAVQVGEAADQGGAEQRLEFIELTAVHQPRDHLAHVIGLLGLRRDDAVQLVGGIQRCARFAGLQLAELAPVEVGHAAAGDGKGVLVVLGVVVGDA